LRFLRIAPDVVGLTLKRKGKPASVMAFESEDDSGPQPPVGLRAVGASLAAAVRGPLRYAADLVLPPICVNCHEPIAVHGKLCAKCWPRIDFICAPLCDRLGVPLPCSDEAVTLSAAALRRTPDFGRARAVARFDGVMRELVHRFKYSDHHELLTLFAPMLRSAGRELLTPADCLMPVPMHPLRLWRRRFNQAALLAGRLGRDTGIPVEFAVLKRIKRTVSQVNLGWQERRANVDAAFAVHPKRTERVRGRHVLLIDDVITTGSTVEACARVLKAAGARQVDVLALAMVANYPAFYD
jgi:ComF family protein